MSKTVLVTGGAGFVGSHLCDFLLERNERVLCVDNLFTGSRKNIEHVRKDDPFTFLERDIIDGYFPNEKIDQVYNLACPASPVHYQSNPIRTVKANTVGMINLLGLARKHHARILQASTSEVYGDPLEHPQKESYLGNVSTIGPRACYDEGKRVAETLCFDYHREHGVDIRVARIFNTYGPRMARDDGRVVSNFIVQGLQDKPITMYGDGSQTRSFCYVADMVEGLYKLMNADDVRGPVNLGNPHEFTIAELADKVEKLTGSRCARISLPLPKNDPQRRKPDITLAKGRLGWAPRIMLDEGLVETVRYFRKNADKFF